MIVGSVRNGLVEATHPVAAVALGQDREVVASSGDFEGRPFYFRSAIKGAQAAVSQSAGADLGTEQLALASASHAAEPVHVAYVEEMLSGFDLTTDDLRCPPDRPSDRDTDRLWAARGRVDGERVFHNCSGKHSAMLRACVASGWSLEYPEADHPLQVRIRDFMSELAGGPVEPTGVDGCGIPTLRGDVVGLGRVFHHLAVDDEFSAVFQAMRRFGPLTSGERRVGGAIARSFPAAVKGGAKGCIGIAWAEGGMAFAAKCWTGSYRAAAVAVLALMDRVGVLPGSVAVALTEVATPPVLGGGEPQGHLQVLEG